jgi:hypothetical protein
LSSCITKEMRQWVQVLETASYRNAGKDYVHKTQNGWTLPRTRRKRELRAPDYPFITKESHFRWFTFYLVIFLSVSSFIFRYSCPLYVARDP